ncbi:hypothetical protein PRVXH_000925 [Proteinivorax hydrogeniformans]|uniref:Uncharacterized protein n=1 Tax=Proteinivorax hydrogeniformans TaxID=1826727 RepID=A0AAU8HW21_9FIRM
MKIKVLILTIFLIFCSTHIHAHEGIFIDRDISTIDKSWQVEDIQHSKAIYSELTEEYEVQFFKFEGQKGDKYYSQILIPQIEGNHNFMVNKILIGEGFPALNKGYDEILPDQYGGIPIAPGNSREEFFEPFTQTSYYKKQQFSMDLEQDGTYYIAVFNPHGQTGKYVLAIGEEEDMSASELLWYPVTWFKVNWWFSPFRPLIMSVIVISLIFVCAKIIQTIRKRKIS